MKLITFTPPNARGGWCQPINRVAQGSFDIIWHRYREKKSHPERIHKSVVEAEAISLPLSIGIGLAIGIEIDCCAHKMARNGECKGGGDSGPDPDGDSDDAAMVP